MKKIHNYESSNMHDSTVIDLQIIAAVVAAVEAYGQLMEQRYQIININPINKIFSPWRVAGLNDQMRSM